MAQSPIAYRLSQIENNQNEMMKSLDVLCQKDHSEGNIVGSVKRNDVIMTLNEYIKSVDSDIELAFSDVNRLGIIIGEIQEKLGMEVTA